LSNIVTKNTVTDEHIGEYEEGWGKRFKIFNKKAMKQKKWIHIISPPGLPLMSRIFSKTKVSLDFQLLCICIYQMNAAHPSKA
jgi:hypothetical protein